MRRAKVPHLGICEPHTKATLTKLRTYVCKMYKLMTGREPCNRDFSANENTPHFNLLRVDKWILDYDAAVEAAAKPLGDKVPDYRERMERLRALAIYCDCVHTDKYIAMAAKYRVRWRLISEANLNLSEAFSASAT